MQTLSKVLLGAFALTAALPAAPIAFSVGSDVSGALNDFLFRIDLATGVATPIGDTGFNDVEGLAFDPLTNDLYAVDDATNQLLTIDVTTGAATAVGAVGFPLFDVGLTFDSAGSLWLVDEVSSLQLLLVDKTTGAAVSIGALGTDVTGIAAFGTQLFGLDDDGPDRLLSINPATGAATDIGPLLNIDLADDGGLAFANDGTLWGIDDEGGQIFTINTTTGEATLITTTLTGFESLAFMPTPEPAAVALTGCGLLALLLLRRRRG